MNIRQKVDLENRENPAAVINSEMKWVAGNEKACDFYNVDSLDGRRITDVFSVDACKTGRDFQKVLNGNKIKVNGKGRLNDGSKYKLECVGEPFSFDGEDFAIMTIVDKEKMNSSPEPSKSAELNSDKFEDISTDELQQIIQNIRIDSPKGMLTLNEIMLDLAVGHNEIEQYKKGGLSLQKAIDERLKEEEKQNPDSNECAVLREIRDSAFGLYLRIQRGDEELHGYREGKYSGYFN